MSRTFTRNQLLSICCYCRQASQSLDNSLTIPATWLGLLAYYDESKKQILREIVTALLPEAQTSPDVPARDSVLPNTIWTAFRHLTNYLANSTGIRNAWELSSAESRFIADAIERFLELLGSPHCPPPERFIDLRMDIHQGVLILEHKLIGCIEVFKARKVEHFNHPQFMKYFAISDLTPWVWDAPLSPQRKQMI